MVEQKITPWDAYADKEDKSVGIDYKKLIEQFGCKEYTKDLCDKMSVLCDAQPHFYFTRNIVFAHRDFDILLSILGKKNVYLYTGRGPSSESMHLGHVIPFTLCKYFQDTFNMPLVIQITDDEKFLFKNITIQESCKYTRENIKDIIAFGFNPDLTYIFTNIESSHKFEKNTLRISKLISVKEAFKVFGFSMDANIGMVQFPAKEIAPCYPSSFSFLDKKAICLVPCAVDQDPYFRLARDKAPLLKESKPVSLYVSLLPDLKGVNRKMSSSDTNSSVYLTDTPAQIAKKINKYAHSGGCDTLQEHIENGGNTDIDIPYQYLKYFHTDTQDLLNIKTAYENGTMSTKEIKQKCIQVIQEYVQAYQERRKNVTDEIVQQFMTEK